MKTYKLETQVVVPAPRDQVFKFFADPRNLEQITPAWLHFALTSPADTVITQGTLIDYRLRLRGIPLRWQSEISVWEPPHRFVDRQIKGPYSLWVHEHKFTDHDGATIVGDSVEYALPGGWLVQRWIVAPDLERIFAFRRQRLQQVFDPANFASARLQAAP